MLTKWNYAEGKSSFKIIKTLPTKVVREGYYQGLELSGKCFYAQFHFNKREWIYAKIHLSLQKHYQKGHFEKEKIYFWSERLCIECYQLDQMK